jgi:hypothetical protein
MRVSQGAHIGHRDEQAAAAAGEAASQRFAITEREGFRPVVTNYRAELS